MKIKKDTYSYFRHMFRDLFKKSLLRASLSIDRSFRNYKQSCQRILSIDQNQKEKLNIGSYWYKKEGRMYLTCSICQFENRFSQIEIIKRKEVNSVLKQIMYFIFSPFRRCYHAFLISFSHWTRVYNFWIIIKASYDNRAFSFCLSWHI